MNAQTSQPVEAVTTDNAKRILEAGVERLISNFDFSPGDAAAVVQLCELVGVEVKNNYRLPLTHLRSAVEALDANDALTVLQVIRSLPKALQESTVIEEQEPFSCVSGESVSPFSVGQYNKGGAFELDNQNLAESALHDPFYSLGASPESRLSALLRI